MGITSTFGASIPLRFLTASRTFTRPFAWMLSFRLPATIFSGAFSLDKGVRWSKIADRVKVIFKPMILKRNLGTNREALELTFERVNEAAWKLTNGEMTNVSASHGQWGGYRVTKAIRVGHQRRPECVACSVWRPDLERISA